MSNEKIVNNTNEIELDKINVINISDKEYFDKVYHVSFAISNAINPVFKVYSDSEQSALDAVIDFYDNGTNDDTMLYESNVDESEVDNYVVAGNYCRYVLIGSFNIEEITE